MYNVKLYFGTNMNVSTPDGVPLSVTPLLWQDFLKREVDTRLPAYSIQEVVGRYTYASMEAVIEGTYVLEIFCDEENYEEVMAVIDVIIEEYKILFVQESVLKVVTKVNFDFV